MTFAPPLGIWDEPSPNTAESRLSLHGLRSRHYAPTALRRRPRSQHLLSGQVCPNDDLASAYVLRPVTPEMAELLDALQPWPDVDVEALLERPEWEQARAWGWAIESGELTGTGLRHVGELPRGIVRE